MIWIWKMDENGAKDVTNMDMDKNKKTYIIAY